MAKEEDRLPKAPQSDVDKMMGQVDAILNNGRIEAIPYPKNLDHVNNPFYISASSDDIWENEGLHITTETVKFIDLQTIIHGERDELRTQQMIFEQNTPQWQQQKAMVTEAGNYFDTHPEEELVDISLQTAQDGTVHALTTGRVPGYQFRTYERDTIDNEFDNAYGFEIQKDDLKNYEETAIKMVVGETVDEEEKKGLRHYLQQKQKRWTEQTSPTREEKIRTKAQKNVHIFDKLLNKVTSYGSDPATDGDISEEDITDVLAGLKHMLGGGSDEDKSTRQMQRPIHPPHKPAE